jgi:8-oxo-dGTP pyrophosphatase MutT (NUDIX family)
MRDTTYELVDILEPFDKQEAAHKQDTLQWIKSGAPLYRIQKPDVPPKHLVSYFAIFDPEHNKMLLQDHLLAQLWVPAGGHVDPDEDPAETVRRECHEELGIPAVFIHNKPQFITVTQTNGQGQHTDVSLWYALEADSSAALTIEPDKFAEVRWWDVDDVLRTPIDSFDPGLHRFITKLRDSKLI